MDLGIGIPAKESRVGAKSTKLTSIEAEAGHHAAEVEVVLGVLAGAHPDHVLQRVEHGKLEGVHAPQVEARVHLREVLWGGAVVWW